MVLYRRQASGFFLFIFLPALLIAVPGTAVPGTPVPEKEVFADRIDSSAILTLGECISICRNSRPEMDLYRQRIRAAGNELRKSTLDLIPDLSAGAAYAFDRGHSHDRRLNMGLDLDIGLTDWIAQLHRIGTLRLDREIACLEKEVFLFRTVISVIRTYTAVLADEQLFKAAEEDYRSGLEQVFQTRGLVESGIQTQHSLMEIIAQNAEEKARLIDAEMQLKNHRMELLGLMGQDFGQEPVLDSGTGSGLQLGKAKIPEAEELFGLIRHLPAFRILEKRLEREQEERKMYRKRIIPDVRLHLRYGSSAYGEDPFSIRDLYYRQGLTTSLQVDIPLGELHGGFLNIRRSRIAEESIRDEIRIMEREMYRDIVRFLNGTKACREHYLAAREHRKAMEESFRYVSELFHLGMLDGTDFILAKSGLNRSRSEYYIAKYELIFSLLVIDFLKLTTFADEKNRTS